jgi:PIN domain nuclease of toxin-antitoxin system
MDTHTLIWWMEGAHQGLFRRVRTLLSNSETRLLISAAVPWELAIKVNVGKIKMSGSLQDLGRVIEQQRFTELPITVEPSVRAGSLAWAPSGSDRPLAGGAGTTARHADRERGRRIRPR